MADTSSYKQDFRQDFEYKVVYIVIQPTMIEKGALQLLSFLLTNLNLENAI